jgi:UDP:flavonoid glycosyltransferase YjiC (YdhE family)
MFTTTSWRGLYYCMIPLGWALQAAGHQVRVTCAPSQAPLISGAGLTAVPVTEDLDLMRRERLARYIAARETVLQAGGATAGLLHPVTGEPVASYDDYDPATEDTGFAEEYAERLDRGHDAVVGYARELRPDLVVHDVMSGEGVLAAAVLGVPAVYCSPGLFGCGEVYLGSPEAFRRYGVSRDPSQIACVIDPTPRLVALDHADRPSWPVAYCPYNGPGAVPDWVLQEPGRPQVAVIVSRSTASIFGPLPALRQAVDAVLALGAEPVITTPRDTVPPLAHGSGPGRVLQEFPLHLLLPTCVAVIHQGSANAIMTTAAAGLPQLSMGLTDDQVAVGLRYAKTGAGLALPGLTATQGELGDAVAALLHDPVLRDAAVQVRADLDGRPAMAGLVGPLEDLARA